MEKAQITRGWAGSYEISPDNHAILGKIPEVEGFYAANGFSGHGFQHSPAAGKVMTELILGEKPSIDFSILSIERLRKGEYIREAMTAFKD
jgi:sarcosine oxidase subunit beta